MKICGAASALPKHYYPQAVIAAELSRMWGGTFPAARVVQKLHARCGVEGRFLSLPLEEYERLTRWGDANNRWIETAEELAGLSLCRAVTRAGVEPRELGALFFTSITGVCSPSIDARLINRMKLSPHIRRAPIFGLGCVGGAAAISRAADYVRAYPEQVAAVVAVELCSLTFQRDDASMANLISTGLFGDGAGAVVIAGSEREVASGPRILDTRSIFYPGTEDVMGWDISEKGFRIVLSPDVPAVVRQHLGADVDAFLADHDFTRADIGSWVIHTGGPKVLEATQEALDLPDGALDASWYCLSRTGNLSSASVLLVLEETLMRRRPAPGTLGILAAMGPGFCAELVLLRW